MNGYKIQNFERFKKNVQYARDPGVGYTHTHDNDISIFDVFISLYSEKVIPSFFDLQPLGFLHIVKEKQRRIFNLMMS